ncbi:hypothetical protein Hamer_G028827, partial [Homarus americanus]
GFISQSTLHNVHTHTYLLVSHSIGSTGVILYPSSIPHVIIYQVSFSGTIVSRSHSNGTQLYPDFIQWYAIIARSHSMVHNYIKSHSIGAQLYPGPFNGTQLYPGHIQWYIIISKSHSIDCTTISRSQSNDGNSDLDLKMATMIFTEHNNSDLNLKMATVILPPEHGNDDPHRNIATVI